MAEIAGGFIENRLLEQLCGEDRRAGFALVDDGDALAVILHLAAGCNHADGIRAVIEQPHLVEVRLIVLADGDRHLRIAEDANAAQRGLFAAVVCVHTENRVDGRRLSAQLCHFRRRGEQDGERVVLRRDRAAVGILQSVRDRERVNAVMIGVAGDRHARDHGGIDLISAGFAVPVHQIIAMDQGTNVHIRGIVAPHVRKERAAHGCRAADNQRIVFCKRSATHQHTQGEQPGQDLFHTHIPPVV